MTRDAKTSTPGLAVTRDFIQENSGKTVSACWHNQSLLMGAHDGQIFYYSADPESNMDPELQETYTITKLKGLRDMSFPIGSMGLTTAINAIAINSLSSANTFGCIENTSFHIWEFSNAVQPVVSFRAAEMPLRSLEWSPHSRHYALLGGTESNVCVLDHRLMSAYGAKRNPVVWNGDKGSTLTSIESVSWHPFVPYWFASASDAGVVSLWDLRSTPTPVVSFSAHNGPVSNVKWCPSHSEILTTSGHDGAYKMWNMALEPHYVLFERQEATPFIHSGFFESDGYNNFGVNQSGDVHYANISPKFMNPIIHSRDFTNGFEKAIAMATKHSRSNSLEKAHTLLSLCFQTNIDDSLSDVLKSTEPKVNMRKEFIKNMETYSYFIPPSYYEKYGTKIVEIFKNKLAFALPIVRLLMYPTVFEKNPLHTPPSQPTAATGKTPIPSPLPSPGPSPKTPHAIAQSPVISRNTGSAGPSPNPNRLSMNIPKVVDPLELEESKINEHLATSESIVQQLSFMRDFTKILMSPSPVSDGSDPDAEDIIDYSSRNRPTIILSSSINRIYLTILAESFIYDQFYIVLLNLLNATEGFEINEPLKELYDAFTPDFISYIENSQARDRAKPWDSERYSTPMLTAISILNNVPVTSMPVEFYKTVSTSIPVFIEELEVSLASMLHTPDPSVALPGKVQASQRATSLFELIKTITSEASAKQAKKVRTPSQAISPQQTKGLMDLQNNIQRHNFNKPIGPLTLPHRLISLTFGRDFNQELGIGVLPETLQQLTFGYFYDAPLRPGVLPQSLTHLVLGARFNCPLETGSLPESLICIVFGDQFNQSMVPGILPPSITSLTYGMAQEDLGQLPPSLVHLTYVVNDSIIPPPMVFPQSLCHLTLYAEFLPVTANHIPPWTTHLNLRRFDVDIPPGLLPSGLVSLSFDGLFNTPISPDILPTTLKTLILSRDFNQVLAPLDRLVSLTSLSFGEQFNREFKPSDLPASLTSLSFGKFYNRMLKVGTLPSNLSCLVLGSGFARPLDKGVVPNSLVNLTLGYKYLLQKLVIAIIPKSLAKLTIDNYNQHQPADDQIFLDKLLQLLTRSITVQIRRCQCQNESTSITLRMLDTNTILHTSPINISIISPTKLSLILTTINK
eukprot:gene1392-1606_t